jgi:uncharacterized protein (TIGR02217 family)
MAAVFPTLPGLGWSVHKRPFFATRVQTSASGQERRAAFWTYPIYRFDLTWNVLRDDRSVRSNVAPTAPADELRNLCAFFLARRGSFEPFWFTDPTDYRVTTQTIATGDAVTTDFPMIRTLAGSASSFAEPVGAINATGFTVTVGGSGASPTLNSPQDGWLHFASPPAAFAPIVVTGSFYFRVRFEADEADFENFMLDLWALQKLTLRSVKG